MQRKTFVNEYDKALDEKKNISTKKVRNHKPPTMSLWFHCFYIIFGGDKVGVPVVEQKIKLQEYFKSLYPDVKGSGIQFRTRCILCGDSRKDPNKMRLGIKVDPDNIDEPVLYRCFNCNRTGVLTNQMLKEIGNAGSTTISKINVDAINNSIMDNGGNTKINRYRNNRTVKVTIPPLKREDKEIRKAKYVFDRLGKIIDPQEFPGIKIIWSLNDFLVVNNIEPNGEYNWLLDKDYVGFLSVNNDFIIFRDITETHKMRYVKYNIFGFYDNSQCFYSIPGRVDLLSPNDIHIKIAEGPFDILSILYNVENGNKDNTIYVASSNGDFYTPLLHYFQKGLVGSNIHIDIYKDNDSKLNYKILKKRLKTYTTSMQNITIYYNGFQNEKDFGVPKDKIQTEIFY